MAETTLVLEHRAALAMNAVAGLIDEDADGIPFFSANLLTRPARLQHGDWDYGSSHGRLMYNGRAEPALDGDLHRPTVEWEW